MIMSPMPPVPWWKKVLWRLGFGRISFKRMTVPAVKRPFPELKAEDITGVQIMSNQDTSILDKFLIRVESKLSEASYDEELDPLAHSPLEEEEFH